MLVLLVLVLLVVVVVVLLLLSAGTVASVPAALSRVVPVMHRSFGNKKDASLSSFATDGIVLVGCATTANFSEARIDRTADDSSQAKKKCQSHHVPDGLDVVADIARVATESFAIRPVSFQITV